MKNKKLNETNNIKLILSNKKLLIRKIVKKRKKIDYHSLSRAKAKEPWLGWPQQAHDQGWKPSGWRGWSLVWNMFNSSCEIESMELNI